jgi:hypothetical protein
MINWMNLFVYGGITIVGIVVWYYVVKWWF